MKTITLKDLAIAFANNQKVDYYDEERCLDQSCSIFSLTEDSLSITNGEYQYDGLSFDDVHIREQQQVYSEEELLTFGKACFYKGFEKAEKDDANCYTAFREEIGGLFEQFKKK